MPSAWVDFVKQFAAKKGISYGCAMSDPEVKSGYAATKPAKVAKAPKEPKMPKEPKAKSKKMLKAELAKMLSNPSFVYDKPELEESMPTGNPKKSMKGIEIKKPYVAPKVEIKKAVNIYPKLVEKKIRELNDLIRKIKQGKTNKEQLTKEFDRIKKTGLDTFGTTYFEERTDYFQKKYGKDWRTSNPDARADSYWDMEDNLTNLYEEANQALKAIVERY